MLLRGSFNILFFKFIKDGLQYGDSLMVGGLNDVLTVFALFGKSWWARLLRLKGSEISL